MKNISTIGSLLTRKRNKAKKIGEDAPVYAVTNDKGFALSTDLHDFTIHSEDTSNYLVVEKNDFAYNPSRLNIGSIAYFKNEGKGLISPMYVVFHADEEKILAEYLFIVIKSEAIRNKIDSLKEIGARFRFDFERWNLIEIPLPSLTEQSRIVGILDTFTAAIDNIREQIALRRKQFDYYREELLSLEGKPGVEMKTITEVAKSYTGLTYKPENVSTTGTLVLRSSNIADDKLTFDDNVFVQMDIPERATAKEDDILICVRNGSKRLVGKAAVITKKADGMAFGAFMTVLRTTAINYKYLFFVWQSEKVKVQYKGDDAMPIAQITSKDFQRIVIPVPSHQEQQRIVTILETFEENIRNLEAQLVQREKQYEYYRNKLLSFE